MAAASLQDQRRARTWVQALQVHADGHSNHAGIKKLLHGGGPASGDRSNVASAPCSSRLRSGRGYGTGPGRLNGSNASVVRTARQPRKVRGESQGLIHRPAVRRALTPDPPIKWPDPWRVWSEAAAIPDPSVLSMGEGLPTPRQFAMCASRSPDPRTPDCLHSRPRLRSQRPLCPLAPSASSTPRPSRLCGSTLLVRPRRDVPPPPRRRRPAATPTPSTPGRPPAAPAGRARDLSALRFLRRPP